MVCIWLVPIMDEKLEFSNSDCGSTILKICLALSNEYEYISMLYPTMSLRGMPQINVYSKWKHKNVHSTYVLLFSCNTLVPKEENGYIGCGIFHDGILQSNR